MSVITGRGERTPSFDSTIDAAAANQRWALEALAADCLPDLISFARARGAADPDGIAAIVMMEFFARLPDLSFETPSHMWAYLYRVARSRIIDERRATKPVDVVDVNQLDDLEDGAVDIDEVVVDRSYVEELLSSLTSDQREVLEMRFLDDLSLAETATRTGRTVTAVKSLQRRAISALSAVLVLAALVGLAVVLFRTQVDSTVISVDPAGTDRGGVEPDAPVLNLEDSLGADAEGESSGGDGSDGALVDTAITSGPSVTTAESAAAFEFVGTSDGESPEQFQCRLDGGDYFDCSSPVELTGLEPGGHVFAVRARVGDNVDPTAAVHVWFIGAEQDGSAEATSAEAVDGGQSPSAGGSAGVSTPLGSTVFKCGPISGTREEIIELGYDVAIGTIGDDVIDVSAGSSPDFVIAGEGNDSIITGDGDDIVCADGGNDSIKSGAGNDRVWGGGGNDTILGGDGDDRVWSGPGNDTVNGGDDGDRINGGSGVDSIHGGQGDDVLHGSSGFDVLIGGTGDDVCTDDEAGALLHETCEPQEPEVAEEPG